MFFIQSVPRSYSLRRLSSPQGRCFVHPIDLLGLRSSPYLVSWSRPWCIMKLQHTLEGNLLPPSFKQKHTSLLMEGPFLSCARSAYLPFSVFNTARARGQSILIFVLQIDVLHMVQSEAGRSTKLVFKVFLFYVYKSPLCRSVYHMWAWCSRNAEEDIG